MVLQQRLMSLRYLALLVPRKLLGIWLFERQIFQIDALNLKYWLQILVGHVKLSEYWVNELMISQR